MKEQQTKSGKILISEDIEIDEDDFTESVSREKDVYSLLESKLDKIIEQTNPLKNYTKSNTKIHFSFNDQKIVGTLENFDIFSYNFEHKLFCTNSIVFWLTFEELKKLFKIFDNILISQLTMQTIVEIEYYKDIKEEFFVLETTNATFSILETNGPFFKVQIKENK